MYSADPMVRVLRQILLRSWALLSLKTSYLKELCSLKASLMGCYMCYIADDRGLTDLNCNITNKCVKKMLKRNKSAKNCLEITQKVTSVKPNSFRCKQTSKFIYSYLYFDKFYIHSKCKISC